VEEQNNFAGVLALTVAGKIQSQDAAGALVKMNAIFGRVLTDRGYTQGQQLSLATTPNLINANADGDTFTEMMFTGTWRKWEATNQMATMQGTASSPVGLGNVNRWADRVDTTRFTPLRAQREHTTGVIEASGTLAGDPNLGLASRRAALLVLQRALKAEVTSAAQVTLAYGDWTQLVRVNSFTAEINQAETGIDWSLAADYILFPNLASYATATYAMTEHDNFTGELRLAVSGKIQAQDEPSARVKLTAILALAKADRNFTTGVQILGMETTPTMIDDNADGATFTELSFSVEYRKWKASNQMATVQGAGAAVGLGNVSKWADRVDTTRFTPLRAQRERTTGVIEAGGTLAGDPNLGVVSRRAALLTMQRTLKVAVSSAPQVTLVYGDWTQVVRVNSFTAEINQAETGIDWSLGADYILFPNLASYATATYTMAERDNFTGELRLLVSGRIQAQDEPSARVKLAAILAQALTDRNFNKGVQILNMETTPAIIDDDTDGATFTELSFSFEYRKWKKSNLMASFGTPAVGLGNVSKWQDRVSISRFNPLRSLRERASDTIEAAGTLAGDPNLGLADRRAALLNLQRALKAAVNVPDGLLVYGDFKQVVRVTEFSAEINQAETGIDWSLSATYTLFPDESNYTTTEWTADQKDNFTGETTLTLAGKIQAATLALAQTALAALTTAVALQNGYTTGAQQLTNDSTSSNLTTMDGGTFIELSFSVSWRQWKSTNQMATFKASNGGTLRGLGNVNRWRDHYAAARFNEMRSQRRHATGSVEASGTLAGQANLSLTARRAALLALQRQLKAQVNCADGTLTYGDWVQCVRVEDFQAEINQAETGIDWSLSASYSLFPNEGGYATAEYTVNDREDVESGDEFFTFNGKISAPTAAMAVAKLNSLRTAVLAMYGWTLAQRLRDEASTQSVYANGDATSYPAGSGVADAADGTTFIELTFSEDYRRRIQGLLVGCTLQVSNREDIPGQTLMTTYSGTVMATGATVDAAYATALARAQALGANREAAIDSTAFLRSSMISFDQRQLTQNSVTEFLRLSFSYEYQSKLAAGRAYLEMTTHVNRDTFGVDVETCSGFVAARDAATAQGIYAELVLPVYEGRLIHSEQTGFTQSQNQRDAEPDYFNQQFLRMEFNIQVYSPKLQGELGMKYSVEVTRDFLTLEMRTALEGSCFALDRPTADAAVAALLLALNFGTSVRSRRHEDREAQPGLGTQPGSGNTQPGSGIGTTDVMVKLDFQEDFVGAVTGQAGVNEMKLTEKVVYSGTRWSVQNLPYEMDGSGGVSIPQPSGVDPGSRVVSGSVTAGTLATAQAWAIAQRALLTGDALGGSYPRQEEWETDYEFVPRIDGIPTGDTANVRLYRVNFQFGEILPLYPKP